MHRCGRCGRAGATGHATTFIVDEDEALVPRLVGVLERSRQVVPPGVRSLAPRVAQKVEQVLASAAAAAAAAAAGVDDEEEERRQMRIANREKQRARQQAKKSKERGMQR